MKNNFYKSSVGNVYLRSSIRSGMATQILYGEKFKILSKKKNWLKIKTNFDNYIGFIKKGKFNSNFEPTKKIYKLKSRIFKKRKNKFIPTKKFLYFATGLMIRNIDGVFIEFEKNKWIKKKHLKKIKFFENNSNKIFKLFLNSKYLWGGKTSDGIDCSSLIQIYFFYNGVFFPRDTKDQIKYCKKKIKKKFTKGDIIFWKGHVGACLNQIKFIHAYGPRKKVLIMPTNETIQHIRKTAKLIVKKISNIKTY